MVEISFRSVPSSTLERSASRHDRERCLLAAILDGIAEPLSG